MASAKADPKSAPRAALSAKAPTPWPMEIVLRRGERMLNVVFDDGDTFSLPAELLRVESPSAEVKGHGGGPPKLVWGKAEVGITEVEPVGRYAVRLHFDDGHNTGLYTWSLLHRLGRDREAIWQAYLERLEREGRPREAS